MAAIAERNQGEAVAVHFKIPYHLQILTHSFFYPTQYRFAPDSRPLLDGGRIVGQ